MVRDPTIVEPRSGNAQEAPHTATGGVGPFVTWAREARADGKTVLRTSRRHRKGLAPLVIASATIRPAVAAEVIGHEWSHLSAPQRIGWWIAVLFMIGAALFAIGGAQGTWPGAPVMAWLDPRSAAWVFFAGSLFFTAAAYLQWLEALNNDVRETALPSPPPPNRWRFLRWCPHNLGYLAAAVQLAGTVLFNVNTADALIQGVGWRGQDVLVWTPDMVGSVCFLVASQAALMEISHHYWSWQPRSLSWWIAAINMAGSILFMLSAVASLVEPGPVVAAPWLSNFATFSGAVCFLVGAYLLIPELFEAPPARAGKSLL
ncbi:MAG: YrhK family protein [Rhodospirillales bacterium]|nr:YrhK family protein [Rhodospirillales bacterium]